MKKRLRIAAAVAALVSVTACSSPPKPAVPDGSSRVQVNDPPRVQAFQDRTAQDRALLTENNLLKAQVQVLNLKLNEMVTIVREALVLPAPAAPPASMQINPALPRPGAVPQQVPSVPKPIAGNALPEHSLKVTSGGMVIRVFHPWAKTDFEPSEAVAHALRQSIQGAQTVEVRGMTDSAVVNPVDRMIAMERAEKARNWLIDNGVAASKIRTKYFSAGHFLSENKTDQGRALNRRVEVDIRNS